MADSTYALIDSGHGRKLEQLGPYVVDRPCSNAIWEPEHPELWERSDASFSRRGGAHWDFRRALPESWTVEIEGSIFKIQPTDFGHLGIFPEHANSWRWIAPRIAARAAEGGTPPQVLNLFAYTGGSTLAAARAGAFVCHLDASAKAVSWARENAALNGLAQDAVRWIVDDALKFLAREQRRGNRYDGICLEPPTYGRGTRNEVFKIDDDLRQLMECARGLLSDRPLFVLLTSHTPSYTPWVLRNVLVQNFMALGGSVAADELLLPSAGQALRLASGAFAAWAGPGSAGGRSD